MEDEPRRDPDESPVENDATEDVHLRSTFRHSVDEGLVRTRRSWPDLLATGMVGGMDVTLGVLALLVVQEVSGSTVAASLAFSIGFLALSLGRSELFTEDFLVPVAAIAAKHNTVASLLRLWSGTLLMNLVGGWLLAWLIVWGLPEVHATAIELASGFVERSNGELAALGVLAGGAITVMTWMEHGAESAFSRVMAVIAIAFLLAAAHLNHVIVVSIEMFVALHTGAAPFGYGELARVAGIAVVTNMAGGLLLVTMMRLIQVGREEIEAERRRPPEESEERSG